MFIKANNTEFNNYLIVEAKGLELLAQQTQGLKIKVPKIHSVNNKELILESIATITCSPEQANLFGCELAKMHQIESPRYGLNYDNYIGLSPQKNMWSNNWGEFFYQFRLNAKLEQVKDKFLRQSWREDLQQLKTKLIPWLNKNCSAPTLIHGDLWSGNYLCDKSSVWMIDPAVYFADSEVDIAMTEMFGGFAPEFYHGYQAIKPLTTAYPVKKVIYNLYHYLNHYNLFGSAYLKDCHRSFHFIKQHL